jgi:hypothetical protein
MREIIMFSSFCAGRSNTAPCAEPFLNDLPPREDWEQISSRGAFMQFELITADGRLFGFDIWDWSMILGGSLLVSLVALLV